MCHAVDYIDCAITGETEAEKRGRDGREKIRVVPPISHTPAHDFAATVAPFRAWRDSRQFVAKEPMRATIEKH